ncbi:J domain-containing protein [Fusarium sp. Ph1]|nr:J domain-containing protein [Fusarium sp. Ph1]
MPSATASGADTGGSARSRDHKQGNQGRTYTPDQEAAVIRIRRCEATAFYDILNLESVKSTCTEAEIKKAYRRQSLLTHPDKNGHPHADEAFKMVSRAFGILGDKEKKEKFDRFGTDPDSRFASAQANNPFFSQRAGGGMNRGGPMFDDDLTPEEMFARFFGGGGGFGGGPFGAFDTGPQFVFNFGGGPGIRVHQFGGARPRTRPREANQGRQNENNGIQTLLGLLPIILFFILPVITSLFSGGSSSSTSAGPRMVYDNPAHPYTEERKTPNLNVQYYVNPDEIAQYDDGKLNKLDRTAELNLVRHLKAECENEMIYRQRLRDTAQGWFYQDPEKMELAEAYTMPSCERLHTLGIGR